MSPKCFTEFCYSTGPPVCCNINMKVHQPEGITATVLTQNCFPKHLSFDDKYFCVSADSHVLTD